MSIPTSNSLVKAVNRMVGRGTGYAHTHFTIPLPPVPCPRPRVTRRGITFYPKRYTDWSKSPVLDEAVPDLVRQIEGPVVLVAEHVVRRARTSVRAYPVGDVDNYAKSILDAITKRERIWRDDDQVVLLVTAKRFARPDEDPHTRVFVREA